jgi:hypothetical protein
MPVPMPPEVYILALVGVGLLIALALLAEIFRD